MNIDDLTIRDVKLVNALLTNKTESTNPIQNGNWYIAILQRGHVVVGKLYKESDYYRMEHASVIRRWGTTAGLGELADSGKLPETKLDKCPDICFHELTTIFLMRCNQENWDVK